MHDTDSPSAVNRRSSENQGTALSKCLLVKRRVGTLLLGVQWAHEEGGWIPVKKTEKASEMLVKHCSWDTCSSSSRFPQFCEGVSFVPFTCLCWIKVCRHPHSQSNVSKNLSFFLSVKVVGISHTKGTSAPVKWPLGIISKQCDVPSCFFFVIVAVAVASVCVCVCVCVC